MKCIPLALLLMLLCSCSDYQREEFPEYVVRAAEDKDRVLVVQPKHGDYAITLTPTHNGDRICIYTTRHRDSFAPRTLTVVRQTNGSPQIIDEKDELNSDIYKED